MRRSGVELLGISVDSHWAHKAFQGEARARHHAVGRLRAEGRGRPRPTTPTSTGAGHRQSHPGPRRRGRQGRLDPTNRRTPASSRAPTSSSTPSPASASPRRPLAAKPQEEVGSRTVRQTRGMHDLRSAPIPPLAVADPRAWGRASCGSSTPTSAARTARRHGRDLRAEAAADPSSATSRSRSKHPRSPALHGRRRGGRPAGRLLRARSTRSTPTAATSDDPHLWAAGGATRASTSTASRSTVAPRRSQNRVRRDFRVRDPRRGHRHPGLLRRRGPPATRRRAGGLAPASAGSRRSSCRSRCRPRRGPRR